MKQKKIQRKRLYEANFSNEAIPWEEHTETIIAKTNSEARSKFKTYLRKNYKNINVRINKIYLKYTPKFLKKYPQFKDLSITEFKLTTIK